MPFVSAIGKQFGRALGVEDAPTLVTRALRKTEILVTEVRSDNSPRELSGVVQRMDAYMVGLQLRRYPKHDHLEDGRVVAHNEFGAGETCIYDLRRGHAFMMLAPFHSVHFLLTRSVLNAIAEDADARWTGELDHKTAVSVPDPTVASLSEIIRPALSQPDEANRLALDHVTLALAAHVLERYGGLRRAGGPPKGGLAPWQERRARDALSANLLGELSLVELARDCGLSVSHFSRAFRRTLGMPPHRWLLSLRVGRAKELMLATNDLLADIALACGFNDQSHFTRVFTAIAGVSPGAWRRSNRE